MARIEYGGRDRWLVHLPAAGHPEVLHVAGLLERDRAARRYVLRAERRCARQSGGHHRKRTATLADRRGHDRAMVQRGRRYLPVLETRGRDDADRLRRSSVCRAHGPEPDMAWSLGARRELGDRK